MNLPAKWKEGTIKVWITVYREFPYYNAKLKRMYLKRGWFGHEEFKEEVLKAVEINAQDRQDWNSLKGFPEFNNLVELETALKNSMNQSGPNLREKAMEALVSSSMTEKDAFISEWLEATKNP